MKDICEGEGFGRYGKVKELQRIERVGICRTYAGRLEWFITFADTGGHCEGGNVSWLLAKYG